MRRKATNREGSNCSNYREAIFLFCSHVSMDGLLRELGQVIRMRYRNCLRQVLRRRGKSSSKQRGGSNFVETIIISY